MTATGIPLTASPRPRPAPAAAGQDFRSDQEVRWCPGCGDYAILAALQGLLPQLGLQRHNTVFISGIGCSSRLPYYLNTYGMHSIHGRAPAIATGLAVARPDLSLWVVTGDGDALSIGGNHLIHALRRNVDITVLLFNNRIYGLTKGQYSPTSETGKVTRSTPMGSVDTPFDPIALALGAGATFVARALDSDRSRLVEVLTAAARHRGSALVEIYQNCPVFNDGAFEALRGTDGVGQRLIPLSHGEPVRFGEHGAYRLVPAQRGGLRVAAPGEAEEHPPLVHDVAADDPCYAFALAHLATCAPGYTVTGVLRAVSRPTYDERMREQIVQARTAAPADLRAMMARGSETWQVP